MDLGTDRCVHLSERFKRLIQYIHHTQSSCVFSMSVSLLVLPKCSTTWHFRGMVAYPDMSSCTLDFPFILASSIFLYFFPALCHSKLNGHSMAQFLRPKICRYPRKTYTTKTAVAAGPWQTDKREASRFEKHYHFSLVFHVQRIDLTHVFQVHPY